MGGMRIYSAINMNNKSIINIANKVIRNQNCPRGFASKSNTSAQDTEPVVKLDRNTSKEPWNNDQIRYG